MSVTINGTTGIAGVDGSASTPAYQGADTNTGIAFPAADTVSIATGGTERMRVDSSGNVGIGTSSPQSFLSVKVSASRQLDVIKDSGDDHLVLKSTAPDASYNLRSIELAGTDVSFSVGSSSGTSYTEAMRIDSSGNLLVGTTTVVSPNPGISFAPGSGSQISIGHGNGQASGTYYVYFAYNGTVIGSITQNGTTAIAYNTSSDYRLKENIAPMTGALEKVTQLNPVTYTWKTDGSAGQGFIAHELQSVVPDCVTGEKDAVETYVDEEGVEQTRPVYQGIDTSFLVATLTAAIQELKAITDTQAQTIAAFEARLSALEGAAQ